MNLKIPGKREKKKSSPDWSSKERDRYHRDRIKRDLYTKIDNGIWVSKITVDFINNYSKVGYVRVTRFTDTREGRIKLSCVTKNEKMYIDSDYTMAFCAYNECINDCRYCEQLYRVTKNLKWEK